MFSERLPPLGYESFTVSKRFENSPNIPIRRYQGTSPVSRITLLQNYGVRPSPLHRFEPFNPMEQLSLLNSQNVWRIANFEGAIEIHRTMYSKLLFFMEKDFDTFIGAHITLATAVRVGEVSQGVLYQVLNWCECSNDLLISWNESFAQPQ